MDVTPEAEIKHRPGQPRSERDAAFLKRYDARMRLPIIVAAILPLIIVPGPANLVDITVGVATWLVFLIDYIVHVRHLEHYGRARLGLFDLFVVVATAPWFLIPGLQAGEFVVVLRLARLARLMMASKGSRRLFDRLGRVAVVAVGVVVLGSLVAYYAEHPVNPEFATVGDALWWGIVTLTTVGYGDIVPQTATGRWAAVGIMLTGVAVLGVLAGSLSSFFRLGEGNNGGGSPGDEPTGPAGTSSDAVLQALTAEVAALRRQVEVLATRLTGTPPDVTSEEPARSEDAAAAPLSEHHQSRSDPGRTLEPVWKPVRWRTIGSDFEPTGVTRLSWLCRDVFPGQADDVDFFRCRLAGVRCPESGGDEDGGARRPGQCGCRAGPDGQGDVRRRRPRRRPGDQAEPGTSLER